MNSHTTLEQRFPPSLIFCLTGTHILVWRHVWSSYMSLTFARLLVLIHRTCTFLCVMPTLPIFALELSLCFHSWPHSDDNHASQRPGKSIYTPGCWSPMVPSSLDHGMYIRHIYLAHLWPYLGWDPCPDHVVRHGRHIWVCCHKFCNIILQHYFFVVGSINLSERSTPIFFSNINRSHSPATPLMHSLPTFHQPSLLQPYSSSTYSGPSPSPLFHPCSTPLIPSPPTSMPPAPSDHILDSSVPIIPGSTLSSLSSASTSFKARRY